jgi:hypothetical protein
MIYTDSEMYASMFPKDNVEEDWSRLSWEASALMDRLTSGVDGIKKLAVYPPTGDDEKSVKMCACNLVHLMHRIELLEQATEQASAIVTDADGTVHGAVVSSKSAGNESISYATGTSASKVTTLSAAAFDPLTRDKLLRDTAIAYLSGVKDANGVGVLYGGAYPHV